MDPGPAGAQPRRPGRALPAGGGRAQELPEGRDPAGRSADRFLFMLAPVMAFMPALLTFAVMPFASPLPTPWGLMNSAVADLPVGFLYILAIGSLGVYGVVLAGWSIEQQVLAAGRPAGLERQMISYEIAMGMSAVAVLLLAGNVTLNDDRGPAAAEPVVRAAAVRRVLHLLHRQLRRDQPAAVRPAGGGGRADRRLSHRVLRDEVLDVLHRRVLEHGDGVAR